MSKFTTVPKAARGLDIVCISDGRLIIGEVKQNQSKFEEEKMLKLAEIANEVSVDTLLFSSLDQKASARTKGLIEKVKKKLRDTNVSVEWFQLEEHIFEPEPMS